jgi:hypothetical protein
VSVESVLFATIMRMEEPQKGKFPVFSLVIREFDHGDWFASDCTIHHPVRQFSDLSEKSLEVRACARGLQSCMDPENALGSPNP